MTESKIEITERLRREGRWSEATRSKDEMLKKLRSEGMKKADASELAWERMAEKYPPLENADLSTAMPTVSASVPPSSPTLSDTDVDALLDRIGDRQRPDLARDVFWAYENLSNGRAKPIDAPSVGAWALLEWARQYRNRFFEQVLPKAMNARSQDDEDATMEREERKSIAEMRGVLQKFNNQFEQSLLADVPGVVQKKVQDILSEWSCRFSITVSDDAEESLKTHVAGLVQDCMSATERSSVDVE